MFCGRKEEGAICDEDDKLVCEEEAHCVLKSFKVATFDFCWL